MKTITVKQRPPKKMVRIKDGDIALIICALREWEKNRRDGAEKVRDRALAADCVAAADEASRLVCLLRSADVLQARML